MGIICGTMPHNNIVETTITKQVLDKACNVCDQMLGNADGLTPIMRAAQDGHEKCLQWLINLNNDAVAPNAKTLRTATYNEALICTAKLGHDRCLQVLLTADADVNIAEWYGETALLYALCKCSSESWSRC